MGPGAKNVVSCGGIGALAVRGAERTSREMIAPTIRHRAGAPMARKLRAQVRSSQEGQMEIRKLGQYKTVNPQDWPEDMELEVMVGLGTGSRDENLVALQMIKQEQKEILLTLGPDNPICTPDQYAHTLARKTGSAQVVERVCPQ